MQHRRKPLSRRGFTVLELVVVISIILVLVGIAIVGMKTVTGNATSKKTKTALSNAASLLAEYDAQTSFKKQPAYMWKIQPVGSSPLPAATKTAAGDVFNIWRDADPVADNEQS